MLRATMSVCLLALFVGCSAYKSDLDRGQRLYEENKWAQALALWRMLETDADSLDPTDRARYAYLRGMTDFRLEFRQDARYWLGLAAALDKEHPGGLSPDWQRRLTETLDELNQDVYGGSERLAESGAPNEAAAATDPATPAETLPDMPTNCESSADCAVGYTCQDRICVKL